MFRRPIAYVEVIVDGGENRNYLANHGPLGPAEANMIRRVGSPGAQPTGARGEDKQEGPLPGPREGKGSGP